MEPWFRAAAVVVLVLSVAGTVAAQGSICNVSEDGINACRPAVTVPNPSEPSADCCSALGSADLACLCTYRNSMLLPALGIDPDLAMQLPTKCSLPTPSPC